MKNQNDATITFFSGLNLSLRRDAARVRTILAIGCKAIYYAASSIGAIKKRDGIEWNERNLHKFFNLKNFYYSPEYNAKQMIGYRDELKRQGFGSYCLHTSPQKHREHLELYVELGLATAIVSDENPGFAMYSKGDRVTYNRPKSEITEVVGVDMVAFVAFHHELLRFYIDYFGTENLKFARELADFDGDIDRWLEAQEDIAETYENQMAGIPRHRCMTLVTLVRHVAERTSANFNHDNAGIATLTIAWDLVRDRYGGEPTKIAPRKRKRWEPWQLRSLPRHLIELIDNRTTNGLAAY